MPLFFALPDQLGNALFLGTCVVAWLFSSEPGENVLVKKIFTKMIMFAEGSLFMVLSSDAKGLGPKKNVDPATIAGLPTEKKRVIFIRHGESDWNDVFNKGFGPSIFLRLGRAMIKEFFMLGSMDSIFLDSPLNKEGIEQAQELEKFLFQNEIGSYDSSVADHISILRGAKENSVVVSSNLRRAIATTTLGLWSRLKRKGEKILVLSCLQEISRNVDTKALSGPNEIPDMSRLTLSLGDTFDPQSVYNVDENFGNKSLTFTGINRMKSFAEWSFKRKESTIIVGGHSLWFKAFFNTFLPFSVDHISKQKKMVNSGVIGFYVYRAIGADGMPIYKIDPDSIVEVYGGFEVGKGKKKLL
jgi:hypothetical protein